MFKHIKDKDINVYYSSKRLSNGQSVLILFDRVQTDDSIEYYVGLAIAKNRKQAFNWYFENSSYLQGKETGKCGLEGLVFAKQQLELFEDFIKNNFHYGRKNVIMVGWEDNRRKNVYQKVLTKRGYTGKGRYLCKEIIK